MPIVSPHAVSDEWSVVTFPKPRVLDVRRDQIREFVLLIRHEVQVDFLDNELEIRIPITRKAGGAGKLRKHVLRADTQLCIPIW